MSLENLVDEGIAIQPFGKGNCIQCAGKVRWNEPAKLFGFGLHARSPNQTRSSYLSSPLDSSTMWRSHPAGIFRWPSFTRLTCVRSTLSEELARMCFANSEALPRFIDSHSANFVIPECYESRMTESTNKATKMVENAKMTHKNAMYAHRVYRLNEWLHQNRLNQTDIARRTEMTRSYISALCTGVKPFGEGIARKLEEKLRMPTGFLDAVDDGGLGPVVTWSKPEDLPRGVYAMVPRVSISLSAGGGATVDEEEMGPPLAFTEEWIRSKHVSAKTNLRICKVSGDSMSPYLEDGDIVMIDTGQRHVVDNNVYCIRYGDDLRIKRLCKRFDGGLRIISDNKNYPEEVLSPEQLQHIAVIGRQIWRAG